MLSLLRRAFVRRTSIAAMSTSPLVRTLPLQIAFASEMLPHPEKAAKGGEDALFIEPSVLAFGVADGVGGWADAGVDPALYARQLMKEAALACRTVLPTPAAAAKPELAVRAALQRAWEQTTALGSSTAFIAFVQPSERRLVLANMGDSGVIVLRPASASSSSSASSSAPADANSYSVAFRTVEQQHYFNCPYQLSSTETHRTHPNTLHDLPKQAFVTTVPIQPSDIVIAATDGVLDNVFDQKIAQLAQELCPRGGDPSACAASLAKAIVTEAHRVGHSSTALSPFAAAARRSGHRYSGGKLDDATAVVAVVKPEAAAESGAAPAAKL